MAEETPGGGGGKKGLDRKQWIAVGVGALGIVVTIYLYARSRSGGATTATTMIPNANNGSGVVGGGVTGSADQNTSLLAGILARLNTNAAASSAAAATGPFSATIRSSGSLGSAFSAYDNSHVGIPLWDSVAGTNLLSYVPFGASSEIVGERTGPTAPGNQNSPTVWYKIKQGGITGWVNAGDIAGFTGTAPASLGSGGPSHVTAVHWPFAHHFHNDPWDAGMEPISTGQLTWSPS